MHGTDGHWLNWGSKVAQTTKIISPNSFPGFFPHGEQIGACQIRCEDRLMTIAWGQTLDDTELRRQECHQSFVTRTFRPHFPHSRRGGQISGTASFTATSVWYRLELPSDWTSGLYGLDKWLWSGYFEKSSFDLSIVWSSPVTIIRPRPCDNP